MQFIRATTNVVLSNSSFLKLNLVKTIWTSKPSYLKEVREIEKGSELIVQGVNYPSPRENYLLKNTNASVCPICSSGLDIKHTDVLILSQFVRSDGCVLPRRITGLCRRQQKRVSSLVAMAQKAGLMSNLTPANSKKDPKKRRGWKKYNKYFDESTIKLK
ncbi:28S ribosomal protein S18a, mitochondrial [Agrilus planipennis]|uniref:Large ribosomal subunit protein mL66 n=1 Tax=Agrilus planipennis TaxID=224129 RepID=A0A1W4WE37_AGRPL|nr:28S ribosomal protein S18a, mitochondrial [Agrilus planipennis]